MKLGFRGAAGIGVEWEAMTLLACLVSLWGLNHRDSSFCAQASSETHRSESVFMCKESETQRLQESASAYRADPEFENRCRWMQCYFLHPDPWEFQSSGVYRDIHTQEGIWGQVSGMLHVHTQVQTDAGAAVTDKIWHCLKAPINIGFSTNTTTSHSNPKSLGLPVMQLCLEPCWAHQELCQLYMKYSMPSQMLSPLKSSECNHSGL